MKSLNELKMIAFAIALAVVPVFAFAAPMGGSAGGGGAQLEAAFRLRGYGLIERVANNAQSNALCSAAVMKAGFNSTKIEIVDRLLDPTTHQPIPGQLDAWTMPGRMQLLATSWTTMLGPNAETGPNGRSISVLVLHEIYRTTGSCNDDQFKISATVYPLLGTPVSNFSENFVFKYFYSVDDSLSTFFAAKSRKDTQFASDQSNFAVCDKGIAEINNNTRITCLIRAGQSGDFKLYKNRRISTEKWESYPGKHLRFNDLDSEDEDPAGSVDLDTLQFVSPEHPYILVHDIINNTWSGGLQ